MWFSESPNKKVDAVILPSAQHVALRRAAISTETNSCYFKKVYHWRTIMFDDQDWHQLFEGNVGGRNVVLPRYGETTDLRVKTTQVEASVIEGLVDENVFPMMMNAGDPIEIDAASTEELVENLCNEGDFTRAEAQVIANYVR